MLNYLSELICLIVSMIKTLFLLFCSILASYGLNAQTEKESFKKQFSVGIRSTFNLFETDNTFGLGTGVQTRVNWNSFLNTEISADWLKTDLKRAGTKESLNLGGAILIIPKQFKELAPYLIVGYQLKQLNIIPLSTLFLDRSSETINTIENVVNAGIGIDYCLSEKCAINFSIQSSLSLTDDARYGLTEIENGYYLETDTFAEKESIQKNIMIQLGINYRISKL